MATNLHMTIDLIDLLSRLKLTQMIAVSSKSEMHQRTFYPKRKPHGLSLRTAKVKMVKLSFMRIWTIRLLLLAKVAKIEVKTDSTSE